MHRVALTLGAALCVVNAPVLNAQEVTERQFGAWTAIHTRDVMTDSIKGRNLRGYSTASPGMLQVVCGTSRSAILLWAMGAGGEGSQIRVRFDDDPPMAPETWQFGGDPARPVFSPQVSENEGLLLLARAKSRMAIEVAHPDVTARYLFDLRGLSRALAFLDCPLK